MTEPAMAHRPPRSRAAISVAVVLALLQLAWLVVPRLSGDRGQSEDVATHVRAAALVNPDDVVAAGPLRQEETLTAAGAVVAAANQPQVVPVRTPVNSPADFARLFAAQTNATQDANDPATTRWAVLIGINDYHSPTRDNVGSRQDAEDLHRHLLALGWRSDHIVLLTDLAATRTAIEQAIAWLASKTNGASVAAFHYSGHTKQWKDRNADADPELPDEGIWPADNKHMVDREFVDRLAAVNAGRLWINLGTCEAAGFEDVGLRRPGRLLTFSSREPEKSYEDPSVGNSVWGYFLFERGLIGRASDPDGNGDITVQEAFGYAAPQSTQRTAAQRPYGPQHPVMIDDAGAFSLRIPPRVQRPTAGSDGEGRCVGNICVPPLPGGPLPD
ncbi:MAG: caspase family protein [Actinomycetota bacterium]|nr:caspase family protein [Actinomycetota bacterium]